MRHKPESAPEKDKSDERIATVSISARRTRFTGLSHGAIDQRRYGASAIRRTRSGSDGQTGT